MRNILSSSKAAMAAILAGAVLIGCEGPEAESIGRAPADAPAVAGGPVDSVADLPAMGPEAPGEPSDPAIAARQNQAPAEAVLAPEGVVPDDEALAAAQSGAAGTDAESDAPTSGASEQSAGDAQAGTDDAVLKQQQEDKASDGLTSGGSSAGASVEDALLMTQVKAALLADPEIRDDNIQVDARQGDITLSGSVENEEQLQQALQVAQGVDGVHNVQNNLKIGN